MKNSKNKQTIDKKIPFSTKMDPNKIKHLKVLAVKEGKHVYDVIEEAITLLFNQKSVHSGK